MSLALRGADIAVPGGVTLGQLGELDSRNATELRQKDFNFGCNGSQLLEGVGPWGALSTLEF